MTEEDKNSGLLGHINKNIFLIVLTLFFIFAISGVVSLGQLSKRDKLLTMLDNQIDLKQDVVFYLSTNQEDKNIKKVADELTDIMTGIASFSKNNRITELDSTVNDLSNQIFKLKAIKYSEKASKELEKLKGLKEKFLRMVFDGASSSTTTMDFIVCELDKEKEKLCSSELESSIFDIIDGPSTYRLSVLLILIASIAGSTLDFLRKDRERKNNQPPINIDEPLIECLGDITNGLGVGIIAVLVITWGGWSFAAEISPESGARLSGIAFNVLIAFIAGLFSKDMYESMGKQKDRLVAKLFRIDQ